MHLVSNLLSYYYNTNGKFNSNKANPKSSSFDENKYTEVLKLTSFADHLNPSFSKRLSIIRENISSIPKCPVCNSDVHLSCKPKEAFNKYCSVKCAANDKELTQSKMDTKVSKYGTKSVSVKRESKFTVDYVNSQIIKLEKYQERLTAISKGNSSKGWEFYCSYHNHTFYVKNVRDMIKGNSNCPICRSESLSKKYMDSIEEFQHKLYEVKKDSITLVGEYTGAHNDTVFSCKEHGEFTSKPYQMLQDQNCPKCYSGTSRQEESLVEFVRSVSCSDILTNTRKIIKGKEIDIFVDGVGIEYNGAYWHSDHIVSKNYHLDKTQKMEELGHSLLHIWSYEWTSPTKRKIWESIIKSKLHKTERVFARKCNVVNLNTTDFKEFLNNSHLQGYVASQFKYGLEYNGQIIAVLGLSTSRFDKKANIEITRYATSLGMSCIGGFSKLLSHFVKTTSFKGKIVSYADRRFSKGNMYIQTGFVLSHTSEPNYTYTKDWSTFLTRYQCQKHKLSKFLPIFDESKSEYENMRANNYYRLFDSGNLVFYKTI